MSSFVELVFQAVGNEKVLAATIQIEESLRRQAQTITGTVVPAATQAASKLQLMSEIAADKLTPSLDHTTKHLLAMGAALVGTHAIYEKFVGTFEQGAHYRQLSLRIGETIKDTVVLEQAFKLAGFTSGEVATAANRIGRALGGVGEDGKSAEIALRRLGTSAAELKAMSFHEQLLGLAEGFSHVQNQSDKANIAMQLFGREGGQMLQLLGDPELLKLAAEQAGSYGDQMQRNAKHLAEVEHQMQGTKVRINELFLAASTQLVPTLEGIAHLLGGVSLQGLGTVLGMAGPNALAGTAAFMAADKLRLWSLNFAEATESGMLRGIASGVSVGAGMVATGLFAGVALVLAAQIVAGVMEATNRGEIQAIYQQADEIRKTHSGTEGRFSAATTQEQIDAARGAAAQDIANLRKERDDLAAKVREISYTSRETGETTVRRVGLTQKEFDRLETLNLAIPKMEGLLQNQWSNAAWQGEQLAKNQAAALHESMKSLVAQLPELRTKSEKGALADMAPEARLFALQDKRVKIENELRVLPAGLNAEEQEAYRLDREIKIAALKKEESEAEKQITAEIKKRDTDEKQAKELEARREIYGLETQMLQAKASGNAEGAQRLKEQIEAKRAALTLDGEDLQLAQARQKAEHDIWQTEQDRANARRAMESERKQLELQLAGIRENLAQIEGDYTRTQAEKWPERKKALNDEIAALEARQRAEQALADRATDPTTKELHTNAAAGFGKDAAGARGQLAGLGAHPNSWLEQTKASLTQLEDQAGTTAQRIGQSIAEIIGSPFRSATSEITTAIVRTGDWGRALNNIGLNIEQSIVGAIVDMGVQWAAHLALMGAKWVATRIGMAAADKTIAAANVAALLPIATATSAVWATPATLATIATFGGAAAAAPEEILAAMAATHGLALASDGGFFPGDPKKARGIFHGDEFVFSAPAVRRIGADNLADMHSAAIAPGAGGGGLGGGSDRGGGNRPINVHLYLDRAAQLRGLEEDIHGIALDVFQKQMRA